jgi:hypothetical protein
MGPNSLECRQRFREIAEAHRVLHQELMQDVLRLWAKCDALKQRSRLLRDQALVLRLQYEAVEEP